MTAARSRVRPAPARVAAGRGTAGRGTAKRGTAARSARTAPVPARSPRPGPGRPAASAPRGRVKSSRTAVRSFPQESTGPRLAVHPRRWAGTRSKLLAGVLGFFVILAVMVTIQAQRIEAQHRIDQLDQQLVAAERRQRDLRVDVAIAESPERIMAEAAALGMVAPAMVVPLASPQRDAATQHGPAQQGAAQQGAVGEGGAGSDG